MKGFVQDIDRLTVGNDDFRRVLYTAEHCQLVLMALKPGEAIGRSAPASPARHGAWLIRTRSPRVIPRTRHTWRP